MRTEVRLALEAARAECSTATRQLIDRALATAAEEFDPVADVEQFMMKFDLGYSGPPRALPSDLLRFRTRFRNEEGAEYDDHASQLQQILTGLGLFPNEDREANICFHLEELLDALVDLAYVVIGTAHLHGFNFREAWRRVHRQNLLKRRAASAKESARDFRFDLIKPVDWLPPSHYDLVENHAHKAR